MVFFGHIATRLDRSMNGATLTFGRQHTHNPFSHFLFYSLPSKPFAHAQAYNFQCNIGFDGKNAIEKRAAACF